MTGYGKAELSLPEKKVTIEIKSLNSKTIDTSLKTPPIYREKELQIRRMIQDRLGRGKIDCSIYYELNEGVNTAQINIPVFEDYYKQIRNVSQKLKLDEQNVVSAILRLPDTIRTEKMILGEEEWKALESGIESALNQLIDFRKQEGISLQKDLELRISNILTFLGEVEPFEYNRINRIKERIGKNLSEQFRAGEVDTNRFEQEMIFYLEKLDISEEKTRLENHCNYFLETMQTEPEAGKKLTFISQEMGREINTLGSKANDSDIQHIVVKMKDELEKIKEQLLNIL